VQSRKRWLLRVGCLGCAFGLVLLAVPTQAQQFAYVTNPLSDSVSVIDTATNTVIATVRGIARPIGVAVSPNGSRVYVTDTLNYVVTVIDTATNTAFADIGVGPIPWALAITPDGSRVYVTCTTAVYVIDTATNTVIATVGVGNGAVGIAVTPDGSRAYVTNGLLNAVSVIDTASNTLIATVGVSNGADGIAVTPDGSRAYVTNGLLNTVSVIDTASNTLIATIGVGYGPGGIAVSPDGSRAYVSTTVGTVSVDTATNAVVATVRVGAGSQGLAITPDGAHVYVTNFASNSVSVVDTATNTVVTTVAVGAGPHGVAITPGSPTTLTSSRNPCIYGQKVTFTATAKPAGQVTPTGKVTFARKYFTETFTIGSATLNANGVATLSRSNLSAASYLITAAYSGDANNPRSTSSVLNQLVLPTSSSATLISSPNPSTQGQAVIFTATITSPTVIPTGPVTFIRGKTLLGTAQLSGGKAKFTTSTLPVGSAPITVTYQGDSNIAKSSTSVTQTVH
jgi:YVTN family beta-propeller protein